LHTFFALNANTTVSFENHANIVAAIADTSDALAASEAAHQFGDVCLLSRGASADADAWRAHSLLEETKFKILVIHDCRQGTAVNNEGAVSCMLLELINLTVDILRVCELAHEEKLVATRLQA
jgi:hypothetical protein